MKSINVYILTILILLFLLIPVREVKAQYYNFAIFSYIPLQVTQILAPPVAPLHILQSDNPPLFTVIFNDLIDPSIAYGYQGGPDSEITVSYKPVRSDGSLIGVTCALMGTCSISTYPYPYYNAITFQPGTPWFHVDIPDNSLVTITVRGTDKGFGTVKRFDGEALDGDKDGLPGGNFYYTFIYKKD